MSADFWAGYFSGAVGIAIGNPLDILKVRLQAGRQSPDTPVSNDGIKKPISHLRGAAAPILGYGALNSVLFVTYNRSLKVLDPSIFDPTKLAGVSLSNIWIAGVLGGLASWVISAPSEVIKCRTQLSVDGQTSSLRVAKEVWKRDGLPGFYLGGVVTCLRDSIGYGFYFCSYELTKRLLLSRQADPFLSATTTEVLLSGGIAGVVTWVSIYPLDVIKTRIQTQSRAPSQSLETGPLLDVHSKSTSSAEITRKLYKSEGIRAFYRGVGICSLRAFVVNAVQWYAYESVMALIRAT